MLPGGALSVYPECVFDGVDTYNRRGNMKAYPRFEKDALTGFVVATYVDGGGGMRRSMNDLFDIASSCRFPARP